MVITAETKIKAALEAHPQLKVVLIQLSPKYKKLNNPLLFKTVGRWATFNDVAKIGGISICVLLHTLNREIGNEEALMERAPECRKEIDRANEEPARAERPEFDNVIPFDVISRDDYFLPEILEKITTLTKNEALKIISDFEPIPLQKMMASKGYRFFTDKQRDDLYETYLFRPTH